MTDLEDDLRDALSSRGAEVTRGDLRDADGPRPRRSLTRLYAPVAASAVVIALGIGIAVVAGTRSPDRTHVAGGHGPGSTSSTPFGTTKHVIVRGGAILLDTQWRLVSVNTGTRTVAVAADPLSGVAFERGGGFVAIDGVNTYSGSYRPTADGVVIGELAGTLIGTVGGKAPSVAATAIARLRGPVATEVDGPTLMMRAGGTTLSFAMRIRPDIDPGFNGVSPSGSVSSTGAPRS